MFYQTYWQQAAAWRDVLLGTSTSTIGGYGCLLCCLASYLDDAGVVLGIRRPEPGVLNRWLARNGGYTGGNLLVFDSVRPLGVEVVNYIDCRVTPAPMPEIIEALRLNLGVIVQVDFKPGGGQNMHWVRLLQADDDDALMMDPWLPPDMAVSWLMARYARPDWPNPARAIMRVVIYAPMELDAGLEFEPVAGAQPGVCAAPWV